MGDPNRFLRLSQAFFAITASTAKRMTASILAVSFFIAPMHVAFADNSKIPTSASESPSGQSERSIDQVPVAREQSSVTLRLPEQSRAQEAHRRPEERKTGRSDTPPDDGGELGAFSEENFPFTYERLSFASAPKLTPDENTGALRYSLPILTPPGRNGIEPKLALMYDSGFVKNEYLGLGWTTNIPYIERINRTGAENLHTDNYFYSSLDGELREAATSSMEEMLLGGGFEFDELRFNSANAQSTITPEILSIEEMLEGKSQDERADIKSEAIVSQLPLETYEDATYGVRVEIQSVEKIDGGVQIFARAWKGKKQLGFGGDGSVEIERFRFLNPPVLIDDPDGGIIREWTDRESGELMRRSLREDPAEAIRRSLAHTIHVAAKDGSDMVVGKRGNTTDTFYPVAGSNSPMDAFYQESSSGTFADARSSSASDYTATNDTTLSVFLRYTGGAVNRFTRMATLFNISSITDTDNVDSATWSGYGVSKANTLGNPEIALLSFSAPSGDGTAGSSDYGISNWGSTEYATRINYSSWSTSAYNDMALNGNGIAFIEAAQTGDNIVRLGQRHGWDMDNSDPGCSSCTGEQDSYLTYYASDQTGTSNDPKLVIVHSEALEPPAAPTELKTEGKTNPADVYDSTPEFSAIYNDPDTDDQANAFRIQVSSSSSFTVTDWDSGTTTMATTTEGTRSPQLSYAGSALASSTTYYWRIRFSDDEGNTGAWSVATSTFVLSSSGGAAYGPLVETGNFNQYLHMADEWWKVIDKYGTVYTFGATTTARQHKQGQSTTTFKWMLEEVRDLNDNYISYEYFQDNGQIYPATITYTGHGSTDGIFEVAFARSYNPDVATTTDAGFPVKTYYKVSQINVTVNGDLVRSYALSYANGYKDINLLLSSVTESGRDELGATTTLPAVTFDYNDGFDMVWTHDTAYATSSMERFVATGQCAGDGIWKDLGMRTIDGNGDGYGDLIHAYPSHNSGLRLNNANKGWDTSLWGVPLNFVTATGGDTGARILDANGDGKPDIFQHESTGTSTYMLTSSGWSATTTYQISPYLTNVKFGDINGDGLVDLVDNHDVVRKAYINKGDDTGWEEETSYVVPEGFYSAGSLLADVNKDNLDDLIISVSTTSGVGYSKAYINKGDGTGWLEDPRYSFPSYFSDVTGDPGTRLVDVTNDGYPDIVLSRTDSIHESGIRKIYVNNGDGTGWSDYGAVTIPVNFASYGKEQGVRLTDLTGDGVLDLVQAVCDTTTIKKVFLNDGDYVDTVNYPDTLTRITSATGEVTDVKYLTTPLYTDENDALYNPNLPLVINTVREVISNNGFGTYATTTYSYSNGEYYFADPRHRKFAGFASTTKTDSAGNVIKTYYHQGNGSLSAIGEHNDDFSKIGKPYRIEAKDAGGNIFSKIIHKWENVDLGNERDFVKLTQTASFAYDGDSDHRETGTTYAFDDETGNLTEKIEYGEVSGSDNGSFTDTGTDKRTTSITYAASTTLHIVGLPSHELLVNQASSTVKDTKHYYDSLALGSVANGNETKTEFWKSASSYASTTRTYNVYGLVTEARDGRSNATTYTYDTPNLYVATSTNALSQTTGYQYDYSLGKPKSVIDANDRVTQTVYDGLDRVVAEKQPDFASPNTLVTKKTIAYTDTVGSRKTVETNYLDGSTDFTVHTYFDGMGRVIQTRREAEVSNQYAVRDVVYNNLGLVQKESLPYFSSGSARTSATATSSLYTTYVYDALRRATTTVTAVGTTTHAYDDWTTTTTDPNGNIKKLTNDAYNRLTTVVEKNGSTYGTTTYAWYANDALATTTDPDGNVRNFTSDGRGLRLTAQDLHDTGDATFGTWTYTYDDAGNLSSRVDPKAQTVNYTYDGLNRVLTEDYTGEAGTEISYAYDSCTNGKSRLCIATSTGAVSTYAYNPVGLVESEIRSIASSTFTTSYEYDRQGQQTGITYPDGSEVQYAYNSAGLLETVEQKESGAGAFSDIVDNFDYAPTQQVTRKEFENGVETVNTYDDTELYRLENIRTMASSTADAGGLGGEGLRFAVAKSAPIAAFGGPDLVQDLLESSPVSDRPARENPRAVEPMPPTPLVEIPPAGETDTEPIADTPVTDVPSAETPPPTAAPTTTPVADTTPADEPEEQFTLPAEDMDEVSIENESARTSLIQNFEDAKVWRDFHRERLEYIEAHKEELPAETLQAAIYAKEKFETTLIEEGYIEKPEDELRESILSVIGRSLKRLIAWFRPDALYAYVFGSEDFESCTSLPCSFNTNATWGSVTPSLDSTSRVAGVDSMKEVVSGEGGGYMEKTGLNASERWFQFKVYIPSSMAWGASGYFTLMLVEDTGDSDRFWLTLENWGTARLTFDGASLPWTNSGIDLTQGAVNTIEVRLKNGTTSGDVDIWVSTSTPHTSGSPSYNGSGTMDVGSSNLDDLFGGLVYAPESGISTTYYDDFIVDSAFIGVANTPPSAPTALLTEGETNPSIVTDSTPEFSALYNDPDTGDLAAKFQLQVSTTSSFTSTHWDSSTTTMATTTAGNRSPDLAYAGSALASSTTYYWRIRFIDDDGNTGEWSTATSTLVLASNTVSSNGIYQDISYTYDDNGNITGITDHSDTGLGKAITYIYDGLNRLTSASTTAASSTSFMHTYAYNKLGNITNKSDVGDYTYAETDYANPHAPTSVNGVTHTYDNNGNLTFDGTYTYTWDYQNRLASAGNGTATSTYKYDHMGNRVSVTEGGVTTVYPNRLYNTATSTSAVTKSIYAGSELVATVEGSGSSSYAIALDTTSTEISTGYLAGPTTKNWTHTVTGTNPIIILSADIFQDVGGTGSITSATWNGGAFTKASSTRTGTKSAEMWYLVATTTGAKTMSVTITGATDAIKMAASSFTGVDQSAPLDAVNTAGGSSGNPSASVTTLTNDDVVVATLNRHSTTGATTNRTSLYNDAVSSTLGAASYQLATTAGSYSDTYTGSASQNWAMVIAGFKPASSGTTTIRYVHPDHLGGTNVVTDEQGEAVQVLDYYPYGSKRMSNGTDVSQREFIGEQFDETTDLSYLNARYYRGAQGQFLSQDPVFVALGNSNQIEAIAKRPQAQLLKDPQLLNSYSYAQNNPASLKDPDGNIVPALLVIYTIYSAAQLAVDYYDYRTMAVNYRNEFSQEQRDQAVARMVFDAAGLLSGYAIGAQQTMRGAVVAIDSLSATLDTIDAIRGDKSYRNIPGNRPIEKSYQFTRQYGGQSTYLQTPQSAQSFSNLRSAGYTSGQSAAILDVANAFGVSSLTSAQISAVQAVRDSFSKK